MKRARLMALFFSAGTLLGVAQQTPKGPSGHGLQPLAAMTQKLVAGLTGGQLSPTPGGKTLQLGGLELPTNPIQAYAEAAATAARLEQEVEGLGEKLKTARDEVTLRKEALEVLPYMSEAELQKVIGAAMLADRRYQKAHPEKAVRISGEGKDLRMEGLEGKPHRRSRSKAHR